MQWFHSRRHCNNDAAKGTVQNVDMDHIDVMMSMVANNFSNCLAWWLWAREGSCCTGLWTIPIIVGIVRKSTSVWPWQCVWNAGRLIHLSYHGVVAAGWHVHFLSDDREFGGRLDFNTTELSGDLTIFADYELHLPVWNQAREHELDMNGLDDDSRGWRK